MLKTIFYLILVKVIEAYFGFAEFVSKIAEKHILAWRNLTRPLVPVLQERERNAQTAAKLEITFIELANQETNHYNYRTWWLEYNQARQLNVN